MNDYFNEDFLTDQEVKKSKKKILIGTLVSLCILISLIIFALYELISTTSKMFPQLYIYYQNPFPLIINIKLRPI